MSLYIGPALYSSLLLTVAASILPPSLYSAVVDLSSGYFCCYPHLVVARRFGNVISSCEPPRRFASIQHCQATIEKSELGREKDVGARGSICSIPHG